MNEVLELQKLQFEEESIRGEHVTDTETVRVLTTWSLLSNHCTKAQ